MKCPKCLKTVLIVVSIVAAIAGAAAVIWANWEKLTALHQFCTQFRVRGTRSRRQRVHARNEHIHPLRMAQQMRHLKMLMQNLPVFMRVMRNLTDGGPRVHIRHTIGEPCEQRH